MRVRDTRGREHSWQIKGHMPARNETRPRSSLHIEARKLIKELYPTDPILEEVPLAGEKLFFDFFLPLRKMAVEVHGEQHYTYNSFFHKSPKDFLLQKKNDSTKRDWCEINNIEIIELSCREEYDDWRRKFRPEK